MPRVCNREGCGNRLVGADGKPTFRKHFCSGECLKADNREKKQAMRARVPGKKCSRCGQKVLQDSGVCADAGAGLELLLHRVERSEAAIGQAVIDAVAGPGKLEYVREI